MSFQILRQPLKSENDLLERCEMLEGLSFSQLASMLAISIPERPELRKGWVGQAIERALGATSGSKSQPDFHELGIELKTIPLNHLCQASESTFVTTIPLLTAHKELWATSSCYQKLKRVLWVPIEGDSQIPYLYRRIGRAILWSPSFEQEKILAQDWYELTSMIGTGRLEEIDASLGCYLQVRPKGANAKSLCYGFNENGDKVLTLPRGFYLRSKFTSKIIAKA